MSCPDWNVLAGLRDARSAGPEEPAGWADALAHLDAGCPLCRRAALAADPALVFRRLRTAGKAQAAESAEADAMRQAVAAMRAARRVDAAGAAGKNGNWKRWAAAAALAAAALAVPGGHLSRVAPRLSSLSQPSLAPSAAPAVPAAFTSEADLPTVEGVNRPGARVYNMDGEGLSVVMIVDESLDV